MLLLSNKINIILISDLVSKAVWCVVTSPWPCVVCSVCSGCRPWASHTVWAGTRWAADYTGVPEPSSVWHPSSDHASPEPTAKPADTQRTHVILLLTFWGKFYLLNMFLIMSEYEYTYVTFTWMRLERFLKRCLFWHASTQCKTFMRPSEIISSRVKSRRMYQNNGCISFLIVFLLKKVILLLKPI